MYKIKDFALKCGCSVHTLRYYDEIGLLKPIEVHQESGYRYYKREQIRDYMDIKEFQEVGFSVNEIKELQDLSHSEIVRRIIAKVEALHMSLEKALVLIHKYYD